ncbi:3-dehydroquinate dehydratase [Agromyces mangrovi Wang et al. 2018]|nr:3-dehydroquinate dehydratase [Agromyces mangrovi]BDZ66524.1 3-dehydroquinate dehydratase [Agromyces mangrovi]
MSHVDRLTNMTTVLVLNGPNLGRLGTREPEVYGSATLDDIRAGLEASAPAGIALELRQTDHEGELIGWLHEAVDRGCPVVLNPAAFTHYSYGMRDAAAMVSKAGLPLIEVHLSNPHTREAFRGYSVVSEIATGVIAGFGPDSYRLAIDQIGRLIG